MPKLQRLRLAAFLAQNGRCCYCGLPMWMTSPDELKSFGLRDRTIFPLRCTAEHLLAQHDGGRTVAGNIAAACRLCNNRRHRRKQAPPPDVYGAIVRLRIAQGRWHSESILRFVRLGKALEASQPLQTARLGIQG